MAALFQVAMPVTAEFEGSIFTDDPADPGGPTRCGITLAWARENHLDIDKDGDVDVDDIRAMTWELAAPAYEARIWIPLQLDRINDQQVGTKIFDLAVNLGPQRAVRYFQRALNLNGFTIKEDGLLGPLTRNAINICSPRNLLLEVCYIQGEHYRAWCSAKEKREKFRKGLMIRAAWPFLGLSALHA